jgi:pilus assembly protein CpaE
MLFALWSPKGGSGTSVLAAACAAALARRGGCRLADLGGDLPAILGLAADPDTGIAEWLATGPEAPADALDRLAVEVAPGLLLIPPGTPRLLAPPAAAEAGAALGAALQRAELPCVVDAGRADGPAARMTVEVADVSVVVLRGCYLGLRRAVNAPLTARAAGIAFVDEPGRSLGAAEIRDVLERPVLTRVPVRPTIARAVDAGVVAVRPPEPLLRAASRLLDVAIRDGGVGDELRRVS